MINYKIDENGIEPFKKYKTDAGYDLHALDSFIVNPKSFSERIDLGIAFEIPEGFYGEIHERSSQGKKGIQTLGNIIDSGYIGNVHVTLANLSDEDYEVNRGDRICQIIFKPIFTSELNRVEMLENSERGDNSHGSTGK